MRTPQCALRSWGEGPGITAPAWGRGLPPRPWLFYIRGLPPRPGSFTSAVSALASAIYAIRAVILLEARRHARVPAEELLHARRLPLHELVAEAAHVVDLLLEVRVRELLIHRAAIVCRPIASRGMPQRRIEDQHRAGRAFGGDRIRKRRRRHGQLMRSRHDHSRPVLRRELVDGNERVDRTDV